MLRRLGGNVARLSKGTLGGLGRDAWSPALPHGTGRCRKRTQRTLPPIRERVRACGCNSPARRATRAGLLRFCCASSGPLREEPEVVLREPDKLVGSKAFQVAAEHGSVGVVRLAVLEVTLYFCVP